MFKGRDSTGMRDGGKRAVTAADGTQMFLRPSLGADTSVTGKLSFDAPTRIDGKLRGEVRAGDLLVIGETGVVEGVVRAVRLIVRGQVHGDILGTRHVEIAAGAVVTGTIEAHSLTVDDGATLNSGVRIAPPRSAAVRLLHASSRRSEP